MVQTVGVKPPKTILSQNILANYSRQNKKS